MCSISTIFKAQHDFVLFSALLSHVSCIPCFLAQPFVSFDVSQILCVVALKYFGRVFGLLKCCKCRTCIDQNALNKYVPVGGHALG